MGYNVYQDNELIAENIEGKEYTVEGLEPDTEYSFSVSEVIGDNESEKATVTVKTKPINVTGVTVSPKTNNLETGSTRQLNATVEPSNATNKSVTFTSTDDAVATVSSSGLVTAVAEGTATITVTTDDGDHTDTATVNVTAPEPEPEVPEEGD